jgi:cupin fold WbuC family metalloprotein
MTRAIGLTELNRFVRDKALYPDTDDPRTPECFIRLSGPRSFAGNSGSILIIEGAANVTFNSDTQTLMPEGGHLRTPYPFLIEPSPEVVIKVIGSLTETPQFHAEAPVVLRPPELVRTSEEAYYALGDIFSIGETELNVLRKEVMNTSRQRVRICCHRNTLAPLHEMFVCYTKSTRIQPHKHLAKDESFHVLEGNLDLIFYNGTGDVIDIVPMAAKGSSKPFYYRVPRDTYHAVVVNSNYCILHEATAGPFERSHTVWADDGWTRHPEASVVRREPHGEEQTTPAIKSASSKAVSTNTRREMAAGRPQKQAIAIALRVQRKAKKVKRGQRMK